jgi:hypothetical protein
LSSLFNFHLLNTKEVADISKAANVSTTPKIPIPDDVAKTVEVSKVDHVSIVAKDSKAFDVLKADDAKTAADVSKNARIPIVAEISNIQNFKFFYLLKLFSIFKLIFSHLIFKIVFNIISKILLYRI